MRFTEIGQQLRAYRLESGLRAEEIAARLGVSRAALYRYEKGEVIKLDTVKRLAELLKISPLSLLGIGVEYYNRPVGYFERIRQTEETADQILHVFNSLCYLTTSDAFDTAYGEACHAVIDQMDGDTAIQLASLEQVQGIMAARKRMYALRKPSVIVILSSSSIQRLLEHGVAGSMALPDAVRRRCRQVAVAEMEHIATLMETEPMGVQFGVSVTADPTSTFKIVRARDRATLAINPFRPDGFPSVQTGVAMITGADEAIATHQRAAEAMWREASRGATGAGLIRRLIQPARAYANA